MPGDNRSTPAVQMLLDSRPGEVPRLALRSREACIALGNISPRTLATWTKRGIVPYVKIEGVLLFPVEGLRNFLAAQTRAATITTAIPTTDGGQAL
jgi:hypothetical protein